MEYYDFKAFSELAVSQCQVGNFTWGYDDKQVDWCGWMDFHNDLKTGASKKKPYFTLYVRYASPIGMLVHKVNGKYVATKLEQGVTFKFDASKLHAYLPEDIAIECVVKQSTTPQKKLGFKRDDTTFDTEVRLIWEWLENK